MQRHQQSIATYLTCRSGSIGILLALMFIPFIGITGIAMDFGRAHFAKTTMQAAADAATLSAASNEVETADKNAMASNIFLSNITNSTYSKDATPTVTVATDRVSLTSTIQVPTTLARMFGIENITVPVTSTASFGKSYGNAAAPCVLALSTTVDGAFYVNGTTNFEAINCGVYTNSVAPESLRAVGAPDVSADQFCTVGGADVDGNFLPLPITGCSPVPDPLAGLAAPPSDDCEGNEKGMSLKKGAHLLSPGTYCGGLELMANAVVTFEPGTYVIKNGPLILRSQSQSTGAGVGFYLTGADARMHVNGGADANLTAASSGPLAGIIAAQDATSNIGATSRLQGGGAVQVVGALYFPTQTFEISGNGDLGQSTSAFAIIADQVHLKGNGSVRIEADFNAAGLPNVPTLPTSIGPTILN